MKNIFLLVIAALIFSSCSKNLVPFTNQLKSAENWEEKDIQRIQFYNSDDIVIQRQRKEGGTSIVSGKVKMVNGREVEEVIIKRKTPGVVVKFPGTNKMGVSFEIDDNHYLTFGANPKRGERYYILADSWENRRGTVHYNDKKFKTVPGSEEVFLLINIKKLDELEIDQRAAKGRKID